MLQSTLFNIAHASHSDRTATNGRSDGKCQHRFGKLKYSIQCYLTLEFSHGEAVCWQCDENAEKISELAGVLTDTHSIVSLRTDLNLDSIGRCIKFSVSPNPVWLFI